MIFKATTYCKGRNILIILCEIANTISKYRYILKPVTIHQFVAVLSIEVSRTANNILKWETRTYSS